MELTAPRGPTAPPARTGSPVGRISPPAASRVLHASRRLLGANVLLACHPLCDAPPISVYHRQASPAPSGALRPCASGSSLWVGLVGEPGKTGPQGAPGDTGKTGAAGAIGTSFVRLFVCSFVGLLSRGLHGWPRVAATCARRTWSRWRRGRPREAWRSRPPRKTGTSGCQWSGRQGRQGRATWAAG